MRPTSGSRLQYQSSFKDLCPSLNHFDKIIWHFDRISPLLRLLDFCTHPGAYENGQSKESTILPSLKITL